MTPAEAKVMAQIDRLKSRAAEGPDILLADRAGKVAEDLRAAMQAIHGGEWRVLIDHDAQFVSVRRTFLR